MGPFVEKVGFSTTKERPSLVDLIAYLLSPVSIRFAKKGEDINMKKTS